MEQFVRINEVKYSTDFDFFMRTQVHVIQHLDNTTTVLQPVRKRCFRRNTTHPLDDIAIMNSIREVHSNIINLKYGGELVF